MKPGDPACAHPADGSPEDRKAGEELGDVGLGDVVGEIAVLGSGARTTSVAATTLLRAIA